MKDRVEEMQLEYNVMSNYIKSKSTTIDLSIRYWDDCVCTDDNVPLTDVKFSGSVKVGSDV